jgi:3-phenylpropionate/cinnamic acid dioxygenase small subunit
MDITEACDRAEIRTLMDRYALACDGGDWKAFRELFTADSVLDYTEFGGGRMDLEGAVAWLSNGLSKYAGLHHNMTTHYCEISGNTAQAITYFLAYHTWIDETGGESMFYNGGFYKDRLVKQPGGWRISERVDLGTWIPAPLPARLNPPPAWYGTMNHHQPRLPEG